MPGLQGPEWWSASNYLTAQIRVSAEQTGDEWSVRLLCPATGTVVLSPHRAIEVVEYARTSPQFQRANLRNLLQDMVEVWEQPDGVLLVWPDNGIPRPATPGLPVELAFKWVRLTLASLTSQEAQNLHVPAAGSEFRPPLNGVPGGESGYVPIWNSRNYNGHQSPDPKPTLDAIEWVALWADAAQTMFANSSPTQPDLEAVDVRMALDETAPRLPGTLGAQGHNWKPQWTPGALIP